jgi:predicted alpha-1,2-mannosidase
MYITMINNLKRLPLLLISFVSVNVLAGNFTRWVNPFIGTGAINGGLSGNCYPGATSPFGMVQLSPDTREAPDWDCASGYDYNDKKIYGFSHTHLSGTGASDLIDILLMPTTKKVTDTPSSRFSHENEEASPGYYKVLLQDDDIVAELTSTPRVGVHRYTYPNGQERWLLLDLNHSAKKGSWNRRIIQSQIKVVSPAVIEGYRIITGWAKLRRVYFHMELSQPMADFSMLTGNQNLGHTSLANGDNLRLMIRFDNTVDAPVVAKVALSTTSVANATANMRAEVEGFDFDGIRQKVDNQWDSLLGKIEVSGTDEQKQMFYTALYHTFIQPNVYSDVNGDYTSTDYTTGHLPSGQSYYSTFSIWDTFRAAHPLYTILVPDRNIAFCQSMLRHYRSYGYLPIWDLWGQDNYCMIGNHAIPILVDAVMKGGTGLNPHEVLQAVVQSASMSHPGSMFEVLDKFGYYPENILSQSVSITLEQSFDDWCVAQLAKHLGHQDIYDRFIKRSGDWRNLYNARNGFFQARDDRGKWLEPFDPLIYGANGGSPYTEGNAWQWRWYVPHDINGLISVSGGRGRFCKKLDEFFTTNARSGELNSNASGFIGQYIHGNEPNHHAPYLYVLAGQPRKTQKLVHNIMTTMYNTSSAGYAGNDDCGEMSAWLVFSSLGFYPVNPANGKYVIGSPLFDHAKIHLPNGKTFEIEAKRQLPSNIYVHGMTLNGKKLSRWYITHDEITKGGILVFNMGE